VGEMIVVVLIAAETLINPAPCWARVCKGWLLFVLDGTFCAVDSKRLRALCATCVVLPLEERSSAAEPATKDVAIDVPDAMEKEPRLTGKVVIMLPPGADTAGLRNSSNDGP
jgi:hypothetical protein